MANQSKPEKKDDGMSCVGFFAPRTDSAKKYWNKFCWLCHKENSADKKKCDKCYHVFHVDCLATDPICIDCKKAKIRSQILDSDDRKMLKLLVQRLISDERMVHFEKQHISKPLTAIKAKIENYTTFAAFLDDIKWTVHKCMAVYSAEESKLATSAVYLQMYCVDQVESMQACAECHMNAWEWPDHHVTKVCKMVHPILWALNKQNSLYWPAKCMSINDSTVTVRFFGYHKQAGVDLKECWLYSHDPPTQKHDEDQLNAEDWLAALKEADIYIENLRKDIGNFVHAAVDTPFDPTAHIRTTKNETAQPHVRSIALIPKLIQPNLAFSTPLINATSVHRLSNPLISDDISTIRFNVTDDQPNSSGLQAKSTKSTSVAKKRKNNDPIAPTLEQKARKSFASSNSQVFSNFLQLNFKEYVDKAKCLCTGMEELEEKINQLQLDKKRIMDENNEQKLELDRLRAENRKLNSQMKQMGEYWNSKLNATKMQQWCLTCGKKPEIPFHCSKACQITYWKKQVVEPEDL